MSFESKLKCFCADQKRHLNDYELIQSRQLHLKTQPENLLRNFEYLCVSADSDSCTNEKSDELACYIIYRTFFSYELSCNKKNRTYCYYPAS